MRASHESQAYRNPLKVSELCDLLNYVLELPRRERIPVPVVASWHKRFDRAPVQAWCESQLILWAVLPKRSGPRSTSHPLVLDAWLKKPWERIA